MTLVIKMPKTPSLSSLPSLQSINDAKTIWLEHDGTHDGTHDGHDDRHDDRLRVPSCSNGHRTVDDSMIYNDSAGAHDGMTVMTVKTRFHQMVSQ